MRIPSLDSQNLYFSLYILFFIFIVLPPHNAMGQSEMDCREHEGYVAPPYQPPKSDPIKSKVHLLDNGDGTLTDTNTGLMWSQKDSYASLNRCLNWLDSREYVKNLRTGQYSDWRMPTIKELITIYDPTKENIMAWDKNPEDPLRLDEKFSEGAAYWYWSSDYGQTGMTHSCAKTLYYPKGLVHFRRFEICNNGGVRAVRNIK